MGSFVYSPSFFGMEADIQQTANLDIVGSGAKGNVSGTDNVGGFMGLASGLASIKGSFAQGQVDGNDGVGGFIGSCDLSILPLESKIAETELVSLIIEDSSAEGQVDGTDNVGGFAGLLVLSEIRNCYSHGPVQGNNYTGGFAGSLRSSSIIYNSYSVGLVEGADYTGGFVGRIDDIGEDFENEVINSYWDTTVSLQVESADGEGRTTAQMKAGTPGDILDEDGNPDEDGDVMYSDWDDTIWYFGTNNNYPRLW